MSEDKKREYLEERVGESRTRILTSVVAAVLILACSLAVVLMIYRNNDYTPVLPPYESNAESPDTSSANSAPETSDISFPPDDASDEESPSDSSTPDTSLPDVSDESSQPEETVFGKTINNIYVYGNSAVSLLGGSASNEPKFAAAMAAYGESLSSKVNVFCCVVPTYAEFYRDGDGKKASSASQLDIIKGIYDGVGDSVTCVDVYGSLAEHIDEYLYYRTDPNWTPLGAYYAYAALAEAMGETPVPLSEYEADTIDEYLGENYNSVELRQLEEDPDYITFYKVDSKYPSDVTHYYHDGTKRTETQMVYRSVSNPIRYGYMIFGCRGTYTFAETGIENGRRILLLADDTRSALSPFLRAHCEQLHVGEIRTFADQVGMDIEQFVEVNGITDVIVMTYTGNARNSYRISDLNDLLSGNEDE